MTKALTKGSPMRLIVGFGIPVLLGYLFQQFYSIVDTAIVGKTLGGMALAAVGSTGSYTGGYLLPSIHLYHYHLCRAACLFPLQLCGWCSAFPGR